MLDINVKWSMMPCDETGKSNVAFVQPHNPLYETAFWGRGQAAIYEGKNGLVRLIVNNLFSNGKRGVGSA